MRPWPMLHGDGLAMQAAIRGAGGSNLPGKSPSARGSGPSASRRSPVREVSDLIFRSSVITWWNALQ